jgi:AcrR family transcriptional regulator
MEAASGSGSTVAEGASACNPTEVLMSTALDSITARKPRRADALRNYEALLAAARDAFAEDGVGASLEDVARRAQVGIGTLYRNFATRDDLIEAVYISEVEALATTADALRGEEPWTALVRWLDRFVDYVGTKHVLIEAMNRDSDVMAACRSAMYEAGAPVLARAQAAGAARGDVGIEDVVRLVAGVAGVAVGDDAERRRMVGLAVDGLRARA